jgi:ribosome-associated protein
MIEITPNIQIDESELTEDFVHASGPGGQNVNKVATAVQLRFDAAGSPSLPPDVKDRLNTLAGSRMTKEGVLIIDARRFRTREKNREDALNRLVDLIRRAAVPPRPRRPTRIPLGVKEDRLENKHRKAQKKEGRAAVRSVDE